MGLLELFILAIGLSMDAFAVSICKGLALPKINLKSAGMVWSISGIDATYRLLTWCKFQKLYRKH